MTHKARILQMLEAAGDRGVRSDVFYREFIGRGAARIGDLRSDGYEITSEREGRFVRYRLQNKAPAASVRGETGAFTDSVPTGLVGKGAGASQQGAPSSVLSGESPETTDGSAPSLAGSSPARVSGDSPTLFEVGRTPFERMRDAEAA